jgi:quercetin 2,3-dioxygenase
MPPVNVRPLQRFALCLYFTRLTGSALALQQPSSSKWQPLPHVEPRRQVLTSSVVQLGAAAAAALTTSTSLSNTANAENTNSALLPSAPSSVSSVGGSGGGGFDRRPRSVVAVDSHVAIPVWPSWAGGRVVPVSLGNALQDPFLLLAHHKHWFDPRDPLRGPFKQAGKLLGLPYVDVEGFSMHPHRGFDIWTYVLDGSDGFRHTDNLNREARVYRGGSCQWMRTGSGVLHEEFWETRPDRRTNIELFQLWVNLGAAQKLDPPAIRYLGQDSATTPWIENTDNNDNNNDNIGSDDNGCWVRDLTATLDTVLVDNIGTSATTHTTDFDGQGPARRRPPLKILHVKVDPGAEFHLKSSSDDTLNAVVYVREGIAQVPDLTTGNDVQVKALHSATFAHNGDCISIRNASSKNSKNNKGKVLDFLLLAAQPLREPVVQAGPIVMNTADEINDAYQQLRDGTFLNRDYVLRQHQQTNRQTWTSA